MAASAPSKVFLIGEYAILAGLPAWVAAISPRFRLVSPDEFDELDEPRSRAIPEQSPAARWVSARGVEGVARALSDPFEGTGGFGASTAEFALVYASALGDTRPMQEVWKAYQTMHVGGSGLQPSGADLAAQWLGGLCRSELEFKEGLPHRISSKVSLASGLRLPIAAFSATMGGSNKVRTHEHLENPELRSTVRSSEFLTAVRPVLESFEEGLSSRDWKKVGACFNDYASVLSRCALESESAARFRSVLGRESGVLGCKGSGALLNDIFLVVYDPSKPMDWLLTAAGLGLKCVQAKLVLEEGVICEG